MHGTYLQSSALFERLLYPVLRAFTMLQLKDPKAAIRDTTAVIETIQGKAAPSDKQCMDLLYKAIFRRVNAHVQCCHESRKGISRSLPDLQSCLDASADWSSGPS